MLPPPQDDVATCRICGNVSLQPYIESGQRFHAKAQVAGVDYQALMYACSNCDHRQFLPDFPADQLAGLYAPMFDDPRNIDWARGHYQNLGDLYALHIARVEALAAELGLGTAARIHDFGCGAGIIVKHLRDRGYNASGSDVSESAINIARELGNVWVFREDLNDPGAWADQRIDLALLCHAIEHVPDPVETLRQLRERLGERAIILLYTNQGAGLLQRVCGFHFDFWCYFPQHLHYFTPRSFRALAEAAGCKVMHLRTTTRYFRQIEDLVMPSAAPWDERTAYVQENLLGPEMEMVIADANSPGREWRPSAPPAGPSPKVWHSHEAFFAASNPTNPWRYLVLADHSRLVPMEYSQRWHYRYYDAAFIGPDWLAHYDGDHIPLLGFVAPTENCYLFSLAYALRFPERSTATLIIRIGDQIVDEIRIRRSYKCTFEFPRVLSADAMIGFALRAGDLPNDQWVNLLVKASRLE